ncbi:MAG: cytidine deaminase [Candidatus Magasanikbacteria bacterium]|nr:cytidine deaminase [Candidatus Magasanikbacteria bacterium]
MKVVKFDTLNENARRLIDEAIKVRIHAYAPYSNFKVGAAATGLPESMYHIASGCNVENAMYEVGHAEQAAILQLAMMSHCDRPLRVAMLAIALTAVTDDQHALPCGFCRQWLREFGDDNMIIYGAKLNAEGKVWQVEVTTLGELLPFSFGPNNLSK